MSAASAIQMVHQKIFWLKHWYTWRYVGKVNRVPWSTGRKIFCYTLLTTIHYNPGKPHNDPLPPIKPVYHSAKLGLNASKN